MGIATLALGCVLAIGWIRSLTLCDSLAVAYRDNRFAIRSYRQNLLLDYQRVGKSKLNQPILSLSSVSADSIWYIYPLEEIETYRWHYGIGDFFLANGLTWSGYCSIYVPAPGPPVSYSITILKLPYWSCILPTLLLTAYQLFIKSNAEVLQKNAQIDAI